MFLKDLKHFNPFPVIFFAGIIFVCVHISILIAKIEDKNLYLADRFDWLYKLIFTITILSMIVRGFVFAQPYLNISTFIVTLCAVSGVVTLLTPRIVDNDNKEF